MKRSLQCQRNLFTQQFIENQFVTRTKYKIVQNIIEREKPFTDGSHIKECIMETAKDLCPQKANLFANVSAFSQFSCAENRRTRREHSNTTRPESQKFFVVFSGAQ